jgi:hypothetical protein
VSASPDKIKVFLCGEGSNELGSRVGHRSYQNDERPGVIHVLLLRVQPNGWEVGGACEWKRIRKFRAGKADHEDTHNVLGAALDAKESGCHVLAFSRDLDKDTARKEAVEEGIRRAPATLANAPEIIGGVAVPTLEGWILALLGVRRTEDMAPKRAAETLAQHGVAPKDGTAMVRVVEESNLAQLPSDAASLRLWLSRAETILPRDVDARAGG